MPRRESNRYGLCHDYVGGSLDVIEACYDYIGSSLDAVETYPSNSLEGISPAFILKSKLGPAYKTCSLAINYQI